MRRSLLVSVLTVLPLVGATAAFGQEDRIRQWDQQTQVYGTAGSTLYVTATGDRSDFVSGPFVSARIEDIRLNPSRYNATSVFQNSGGQWSVRFEVPNAQRSWDGQVLCIFKSNGAVADADRIRIF